MIAAAVPTNVAETKRALTSERVLDIWFELNVFTQNVGLD